MVSFTNEKLGSFTLVQNGNEFEIEIRRGNCLAVMIYDTGEYYSLFNFYADEQHIKNILKNEYKLFNDEVKNVRLNMKYKESKTLLKYFLGEIDKVICYNE